MLQHLAADSGGVCGARKLGEQDRRLGAVVHAAELGSILRAQGDLGGAEGVADREGGVTIEPPITPAAELHARRGTKPASAEDFERLSVDVPFDDEG